MFVPREFPDRSVCIFGLGYVGLTLATTMASVGFRVWGVEIRPEVVDSLRVGKAHFHEPGLESQLRQAIQNGSLSIHRQLPSDCDATTFVITVGTPLGKNGRARFDMIKNVANELAGSMPAGALIIVRSTVRLGTTRKVVAQVLDGSHKPYALAFCPERTLEGVALRELRLLPQIVGGDNLTTTVRAAQLFQFITPTTVQVRDIETAEMIKLVDNSQRDVLFAFSNEVALMCDAVGISAVDVINAGKLGYPRTNLFAPGPVGGPCLEKDPYILAEGLEPYRIEPTITLSARKLNERQPAESIAALKRVTDTVGFPTQPIIALLGLAFKGRPATDDLRGTMARPILNELRAQYPSARLRGYDAVVDAEAIRSFGLDPAASLEDAFAGTHIAVIANNHSVFSDMPIEAIARAMAEPAIIYDFWNNFDARELSLPAAVGYMALGSHGCARLPNITKD